MDANALAEQTQTIDLADLPEHPARTASMRSIAAVMAGDREAWIDCFAPDALIEDPVGPSVLDESGEGHRGHDAIRSFWDTSISSMQSIEFLVERSHAGGDRCANVGRIRNVLGDGSTVVVTGVFVYRVDDAGLVTHLQAFWQFDQMVFTPAS